MSPSSRRRPARVTVAGAVLAAPTLVLSCAVTGPALAARPGSAGPQVDISVTRVADRAGDLRVEDSSAVPERVITRSDLSRVSYKTDFGARYVQVTYRPADVHSDRRVRQIFASTYRRPGTGSRVTLTASVVAAAARPFRVVTLIDGRADSCAGARVRVVRTEIGNDKVVHRVPFACLRLELRGTVEVGSYSLVEGRADAGDLGIDRVARTRILPPG